MAGIGFELRRLARADRFSANLRGMAYATIISSGPWLFTCIALAAVQLLGQHHADAEQLRRFSILIIYNFSFSLVISGPIVLVVTRCLADAIYAKDVREVSGLFEPDGRWISGELEEADPQLCGWVAGPIFGNHRLSASQGT